MTFDSRERSNYDGEPIALYEFQLGDTYWRYTSDEMDVLVPSSGGPLVYTATAISDGGFVQSGEAQSSDVLITMPSSTPVAQIFSATPPSEELWLTIRRKHHGEDAAPVMWVGTVASSKQTNLRTTQFTCQLINSTFNRNGLRLPWGRQCPHALYDRMCRVNKALYAATMAVQELSGNLVTSTALGLYPEGWFANGFFEFVMIPGAIERRAIEYHSGSAFTILGTSEGLSVGDTIMVYPGCSRTTYQCINKFNNLSNFGGFPHLPGKSPFDGDPVF